MEKASASLSWRLFVDCPNCGELLDLANWLYDNEGEISKPIFNNKWDDLIGVGIECDRCHESFEISGVEN